MKAFWKCPPPPIGWDYESVKQEKRTKALVKRCERLLVKMRRGSFPLVDRACDTRPIHRKMFRWMTPICFPSFAGNYRGDTRYRCLVDYPVGVPSDPSVGSAPQLVTGEIRVLSSSIRKFVEVLEQAHHLDPVQRFGAVVQAVSYVLAEFLRIHPYANGNGHMGRFIVWALLLRFGYVPKKWPLEERPPDPLYGHYLTMWRAGYKDPLHKLIADCIIG